MFVLLRVTNPKEMTGIVVERFGDSFGKGLSFSATYVQMWMVAEARRKQHGGIWAIAEVAPHEPQRPGWHYQRIQERAGTHRPKNPA